ncbi:RDD family protein [Gulosibacter sediminis]|uniref:RDD family protein n=1 Tax=Gulosibacter sediminis TaxID=1729695 RepID=UPI0024A8FB40|nr:RDD family protein [Gulosibacter sediminis]
MPRNSSPNAEPDRHYQGERLGLPEAGPGSMAGFGRRLAGLAIDWGVAVAIAYFAFDYNPVAIMGIFIGLSWLGIALLGGSLGHLLCGMRLNTVAGATPGWWRPLVRQVLVMLVLPPLVADEDGRGMHDVLTGLVLRRYVRS